MSDSTPKLLQLQGPLTSSQIIWRWRSSCSACGHGKRALCRVQCGGEAGAAEVGREGGGRPGEGLGALRIPRRRRAAVRHRDLGRQDAHSPAGGPLPPGITGATALSPTVPATALESSLTP